MKLIPILTFAVVVSVGAISTDAKAGKNDGWHDTGWKRNACLKMKRRWHHRICSAISRKASGTLNYYRFRNNCNRTVVFYYITNGQQPPSRYVYSKVIARGLVGSSRRWCVEPGRSGYSYIKPCFIGDSKCRRKAKRWLRTKMR